MSGQGWSYGPLDLSLDDLKSPPSPTGAVASGAPPQPTPTGVAASGAQPSPNLLDQKKWLFDQRFKYGMELFKFHADQRMKMFQFFLLFVGLVASAYGALLTKGIFIIASLLAFFAAVLTIGFLSLEHRNEELVHIAEDVLASLESDALFVGYNRPIPWPRRRTLWRKMGPKGLTLRPVGIFRRAAADTYGIFRDEKTEIRDFKNCEGNNCEGTEEPARSPHEHGRWLPWVEKFVFTLFIVLGIFPWILYIASFCGYSLGLGVEVPK